MEKLYFSFIRPLLEYSDLVWDNCSIELKRELEAIQVEAARIVTGATKLCNIDKLYNELKWEKLETRRKNHKLVTFYKMSNNLSPQYLVDLIPEPIQNRYTLRDNNNVPLIALNYTKIHSCLA